MHPVPPMANFKYCAKIYFTSNISCRIISTKLYIVISIHLKGGNPLGELPFMSIENPTLAHFRHFSSLFTNLPSITLFLCAFCASLRLKNLFNQRNQRLMNYLPSLMSLWPKNPCDPRNPWLINDLRVCKELYNCRETFTNVMSALQINLFMQNKANFRKVKLNVTKVLTKDYDRMDTWSIRKTKPIQSQFKPNSKPIQTQLKPKQTQTKPISNIKLQKAFFRNT